MAVSGGLAKSSSQERSDLVAYWSVHLLDGVHTVEFEHGSTTGKRVLRVDGKVNNIIFFLQRSKNVFFFH